MKKLFMGLWSVVGALPLAAQTKPNIAGAWQVPLEQTAMVPLPPIGVTGTGVKAIAGQRITQTADTVTIFGGGLVQKYALDGGQTTNCTRSDGRCYDTKCRAHWEGPVFATSCRVMWESGRESITTQRYWIDADGNLRSSGLHTTQGVTVTYTTTYVRQGALIFEMGAEKG